MNLIVVDKCTNYCKYCFASNEMAKNSAKAVLKEENIPLVLDYIRNSGPNFELNVIGGEPFLYRQLPFLLEQVLSLKNVSKICVFTGGIASPKIVDKICHLDNDRITFLFNMNEKKDYKTVKEYDLVLENFDLLLSHGFRAIFGYNIYEEEFDYNEILNLCEKYGTPILRWTVAFPELTKNDYTQTLKPEQYKNVASNVFKFLEEAFQRGIDAGLDCPIPKCFFSHEQLGRIALTQPLTLKSIKACGPVIDVTPDLEVFRCYALADLKRKHLSDFNNFQDTIAYYEENIDEIYNIPQTFDYCSTCEFALNQTCYGGCMAHSPDAVATRMPFNVLVSSMYEYIQKDEYEKAKYIFYDKANNLHKNSLANYIMSFCAEKEGDLETAKTMLRKSIINATSSENAKQFAQRFNYLETLTLEER